MQRREQQPNPDIRIEYPSRDATYFPPVYGVYSYGSDPRPSGLSGEERRTFLGSYATLGEAQAAHPTAIVVESAGYRESSFNHSSDEG